MKWFTRSKPKRHSGFLTVYLHCGHDQTHPMEQMPAIAAGRKMVLCNQCGEMRHPEFFKVSVIEDT